MLKYESPTTIEVLTIDGKVISYFKEVGNSTVVQLPQARVYFVKAIGEGTTEIEKVVLRQLLSKSRERIISKKRN
ncbi:MAG: hypothetical protein KJP21_00490 [Bacteroidia bacterium]|nr:hypothetical protein [Bacteroidia bacterium]NNJ56100.1 hypothetical protein [Bacteroidia bacterium]